MGLFLELSRPVVAIQTPILHGFGDVLGADVRRAAKVGDRARGFQDAIVRARREAHAADGHFECAFACVIERADLADGARRHSRIVEPAR